MEKNSKTIRIGLLGFGTVGSGVVKILSSQKKSIEEKAGVRIEIKKIGVRNLSKKRAVSVDKKLITTDLNSVVNDASVDVVVELMGGIHPAKELILKALSNGKQVVTANKALLAEESKAIFGAAQKEGRSLGIEASVCGGIPILKALREGLVSNNISHFFGIVNGTCNFILSEMSKGGLDFNQALAQAKKLGYAESNPRLDIEGIDSAHKLAVLARIAFGAEINFKTIYVEGINQISPEDVGYAKELGYTIKLLAIGKKLNEGLELRVHPTMLAEDHPLSNVRGVYNAVFVHGDQVGDLLFYGRGAGSLPTASAVLSDIVDLAQNIKGEDAAVRQLKTLPIDNILSKYYLRFQVKDRPGVLGRIAQELGKNQISILSVHQKESAHGGSVPVVILTYEAREKNLKKALRAIDAMGDIRQKTVVMRVEK